MLRKTTGFRASLAALVIISAGLSAGLAAKAETEETPGGHAATPPRQSWSFYGPFGKYDQAQLQRGFQVFREVCSNCHSLKMIAFRDLADPSGPGFSEGQAKALAATFKIKDGPNEAGELYERPGVLSDYYPWNFPNPQAARAALNATPPDLSVIAKARTYERGFPLFLIDPIIQYQEQGVDYIYALLTGYTHADDPYWDEFMPGHKIAMPNPLADGAVDYTDGSPKTAQQYARDVSAFLMWAAEPKLEERKRLGFRVLVFLAVFAALLYFVKRKIWAKVHGDHGSAAH